MATGILLALLAVLAGAGSSLAAGPGVLRMELIHRHSERSPYFRRFASRYEMVHEMLRLDAVRRRTPAPEDGPPAAAAAAAASASAPAPAPFFTPLYSGASMGAALYLAELYIGTPPQRALVVADTGSDLTWVRCSLCQICPPGEHPSPTFFAAKSSSLSYVPCASPQCGAVSPNLPCSPGRRPPRPCEYSYGYMDNSSTSGPLVRDAVTLNSTAAGGGPFAAGRIALGCGTDAHMATNVSSGGVLGLGRGEISFASQTAAIYGGTFSYCLADYLDPATVKTSLVFGSAILDKLALKEPVHYTPLLSGEGLLNGDGQYYVGVEGIRVNGEKLPISGDVWEMDEFGNGGTIVDSGTSLTYFAEEAYEVIMEALRVAIPYPRASTFSPQQFDLCFNVSAEAGEPRWPEFAIDLRGGVRIAPPADNYMLDVEEGVKCVGFTPAGGQSWANIIGNLLQQNLFVQFDRRRSVVGFARADCDSHNNS